MKVLVKMIAGSHLYGTNTENSDIDYKGVYLPEVRDCILGKVKQTLSETTGNNETKNTKDDVDSELYSIQHFIKLASAGETVAIDMLHTPDRFITEQTEAWKFIRDKRSMFYTKNMKAFIGYARSQAKRYSMKGERLQLAEDCLAIIKNKVDDCKLGDSFFMLKNIKGTSFTFDEFGMEYIDINGRKFAKSVTIKYAKDKIQGIIDEYGHRAKKAQEEGGFDWKAISHAMRVTMEIKEILTTGNLIFPLANAKSILGIKKGEYRPRFVLVMLDRLINEVEELSLKSNLPEKVDTKFWEDFIVNLYK